MKSRVKRFFIESTDWAIKFVAYTSLFFIFMFTMGKNGNPQLLRLSRTSIIVTFIYIIMAVIVKSIYGGFDFGEKGTKQIMLSMIVSVLLSDVVVYTALEIMNVNSFKYSTLRLFGADLTPFAWSIGLQIASVLLFSFVGNRCYIIFNPPIDTLVVLGDGISQEFAALKLKKIAHEFTPVKYLNINSPALDNELKLASSVFLFAVPSAKRVEIVSYCYTQKKPVAFEPDEYDIVSGGSDMIFVDDVMVMRHKKQGLSLTQRFVKRFLDLVITIPVMIIALPIMGVCALLIKKDDKSSKVLYIQNRVTYKGRVFKIYKFRTMKPHTGEATILTQVGDNRVTKIGQTLRKYRLDELPQLFNIIKGDMSLVGPRPEMLAVVEESTKQLPGYVNRLRVKSGLTGYAQIFGKYNTLPREKLLMDLHYIEHYSVWQDIKLLFQTITVIFKPESTEAFKDEKGIKKS